MNVRLIDILIWRYSKVGDVILLMIRELASITVINLEEDIPS